MARLSASLGSLCFCLVGCCALWRYRTNTGDYYIFSTRSTIHLEYEGTSFQEWDTGSFCIARDKSLTKTTMHCTIPGTHKIFPVVTNPTFGDYERFLSVISDVNCFMWYVHQEISLIEGAFLDTQAITAWIFDPENAHESELNHTAVSPPLYSKSLSKRFWLLGQRPSIVTVLQKKTYRGKARQEGSWTIVVPTISNDVIAHIFGSAITFQDCFVLDTPIVVAQLGTKTFADKRGISVSLPAGSDSKVTWSACVPTAAVLATDLGVFFTTDGFLTSSEITIPADILNMTMSDKIKDLAIVNRDILILIESLVYRISVQEVYILGDMGIPENEVVGIQARTWCASSYPIDKNPISDMLIWTADEIYRGFPGDEYVPLENTDNLKKHLQLKDTVDLKILTVCYDSLPSMIVTLLECTGCMSTPTLYLAAFDEETLQWFLRDFSLPPSTNGDMHMEVFYSAETSMVLWNDDTVYYKGNKIHGYLKLAYSNVIFSASIVGSTIHQIIIDQTANSIIKLKNNDIYFFKFEMTEVIRLPVWVNETTNCIFYSNPSGDVYLLTIDGRNISRQIYPLKLEVFSATYETQDICPYISFQHNIELPTYYLDKGENITFWSQIVFQENLGLSTNIQIYMPELLKQKTHVHYEIARGICTKNWTITFYHDQDYSEVNNYTEEMNRSSGTMTLEMKPSSSGKTCMSKNMLSYISVGCYPEKRIMVDSARSSVCKKFNYTIPQKYLWVPTGEKDLHLQYNKEYGCPINIHHATPFRPVLGIYINKKRTGTVESNYILWEINGRKDFSYNATMKQVRCSHIAQNWTMMIHEENNMTFKEAIALDEETFMKVWGPHNYKSCFAADHIDQRHLEEEYIILNNSGNNFIIWPQYHTGIYMFRLRIVDPNFSFCDQYVKFSVRTYGVIKRTNFLKIAGWAILIVTLFSGVLLCSYFRYVKIFRNLHYVDPLQSFRQPHSPTESAEELKEE